MSIHGDDVVMAIRRGLLQYTTSQSMTDVEIVPNAERDWPNRDGRLQFYAVGRDWFRAFRITVEAVAVDDVVGRLTQARPDGSFDVEDVEREQSPEHLPSLPWTWTGGYPQRITGPDATLIAEVFESPDMAAVIAPTICAAVNAHFGWDGEATYPEKIEPC